MSIYDRLEPNIEDAKTSAMDQDIMLSIAISLKRIADKLELANKQPILMSADEYQRYSEAKDRKEQARKALAAVAMNNIKDYE